MPIRVSDSCSCISYSALPPYNQGIKRRKIPALEQLLSSLETDKELVFKGSVGSAGPQAGWAAREQRGGGSVFNRWLGVRLVEHRAAPTPGRREWQTQSTRRLCTSVPLGELQGCIVTVAQHVHG